VILSSPTSSTNFTADTIPTVSGAAVTSLSQVVCPPGTSNCVAIGTTAAGPAILTGSITSGLDTWAADPILGTGPFAGLSTLICPASSGGCIATGINTSTNPGTPIVVSGGYGLSWTATSPNPAGVTLTSASYLACPSTTISTTCLLAGRTATGPALVSGTAAAGLGVAAPVWTSSADTLPAGTAALTGLNCPPTAGKCLLTGFNAALAPVVIYGAATPGTGVPFTNDTLPTAVAANGIACPTATACVIIGTNSGSPAILSGTITGPTLADGWANVSLPSVAPNTLTRLSQVVCWTSPSCAVTAIGTNASNPVALLLTSTGTMTTWSSTGLPTSNPASYLTGIDCVQPGSSTSYCTAVGANATGAVELSSATGPGGAWSDATPSGLSGFTPLGVPVEINNTGLLPSSSQTLITPGWTTSPTTPLPPVYPFTNGYSVYAGDCAAEAAPIFNVAHVATVPGGSSPTTTLPLGLISIQALHALGTSTGVPYAGATFSLLATSASPCGANTYTLQTAGIDGLSRTEVPYGTYTLTVTTSASTTTVTGVIVGGSSVVANGNTYVLPNPIQVSVS
jgi:hypothetical protein